MESLYFQFVNFIQGMDTLWFMTIWIALLAIILSSIVKVYSSYNGEKKKFEKVSFLFLAIILIAVLIYLTYLRN